MFSLNDSNGNFNENSFHNFVSSITEFNTGKSISTNSGNLNQSGCLNILNDQMNRSYSNNFHQFQDFNQEQPIRTTATLANLNNRSIIINNRENIAPETVSDDENEPKITNRTRGPVVLEFVENATERSQTKYKRSKNVASKVISNEFIFQFNNILIIIVG